MLLAGHPLDDKRPGRVSRYRRIEGFCDSRHSPAQCFARVPYRRVALGGLDGTGQRRRTRRWLACSTTPGARRGHIEMHKVLGRLGFRNRHKHQRQLAGLGGIILGGSITTSSGSSNVTGHASAPDQNRASPAGSAASTTRWTRRVDIGPTVAAPNDSDKRQRSTGSPATPSRGSGRCKRARRGVLDQDSAVTRLSRPRRACRPRHRLRATRGMRSIVARCRHPRYRSAG